MVNTVSVNCHERGIRLCHSGLGLDRYSIELSMNVAGMSSCSYIGLFYHCKSKMALGRP
jgi:hypothetical protein